MKKIQIQAQYLHREVLTSLLKKILPLIFEFSRQRTCSTRLLFIHTNHLVRVETDLAYNVYLDDMFE